MARRTYTMRLVCAEPGCGKTSFSESETRKEEAETREWYAKHPYRCYRHTAPNEVLSADNPTTTAVLIASKVETTARSLYDTAPGPRYLNGLFWLKQGKDHGGSGLESGPGFRAIASDLPEGTRLVITARLEFPSGDTASAELVDFDEPVKAVSHQ